MGADGEAQQTVYQADLTLSLAVVIGAEGSGMRRLTKEQCDLRVKLPMLGKVESLNLSVATGVFLYEAVRQRQGKDMINNVMSNISVGCAEELAVKCVQHL